VSRFLLGNLLECLGTLWIRVRRSGLENLPREDACLVCSNHVSYLDGPAFAKAVRKWRSGSFAALGLEKYFTGGVKGVIADAFHVVPTNPERNIRSTIRRAAAALKSGTALYISPEGGRSADGRLGKLRPGASILAVEMDIPIVPAVIEGTYDLWPRQARFPRPGAVTITFGEPIFPREIIGDLRGEEAYGIVTQTLRSRLIELGAPDRIGEVAS
jgi:long-chain acyl-CoA synthetase